MAQTEYFFDTAERVEKQRLEAQTAFWDAFTFRKLDEVGVADGWQCLEVGGGTGSVAAWLLERVGDGGHVVATDLATRWLEPFAAPNCEVRRHDVVVDPLEVARYDLIHARLLLMHLPQRAAVMAKLAAALRPGGWLVVDDYELCTVGRAHPPNGPWTRVAEASTRVLQEVGADVGYGTKLPTALRSVGLGQVSAEGSLFIRRAPEMAAMLLPMLERMRQPILGSGAVSAAEFDGVISELEDDASPLSVCSPIMVSARGRRVDEPGCERRTHDTTGQ